MVASVSASISDLLSQSTPALALGQANGYLLANVLLILGSFIVIAILKLVLSILEPSNYKLDMTTKEYCKTIAEIDNTLRLQRGNCGELYRPINASSDMTNGEQEMFDRRNGKQPDKNNPYERNDESSPITAASESNVHIGSANHVYPNGWIPIMESRKVRPGTIKKAIIFGRDLIVTRSSDGTQVNVLDAYCPHVGVHIGIGGQVTQVDNESCVECPFHGWTFRSSDGLCVKIPYQKKRNIPKLAKLGSWDCVEVDNFIYVWHHIDNCPPSWHYIPSKELETNGWQLAARSCHKTNLELRDMLENGADMNHFEAIHNDLFILGNHITALRPLKYLQQYVRHHWLPEWKPLVNQVGKMTHMAEMKLQSWITLFKLRLFDVTVHAIQIGPARVDLRYNSEWYGKGLLIMNAIPKGGRQTKYYQHVYTKRNLFQCFMAKWVLYGEIRMLERDFFIWNHKKNIRNPIFVQEDKLLRQFRLWYSQFHKRTRKIVIEDNSNCEGTNNDEIEVMLCKRNSDLDF